MALFASAVALGQAGSAPTPQIAAAEAQTKSVGMIKEVVLGLFTDAPSQVEADRFYLGYHAPEVVRGSGPWLRRYESYMFLDPPADAVERFGATKGRYAELWYDSLDAYHSRPQHLPFSIPSWEPKSSKIPKGGKYAVLVPALPTEEFHDPDPNPNETPILRWVTVMKYPEGVSQEEGEKWFLNVYAKEALKQPGLLKFVSYHCISTKTAATGALPATPTNSENSNSEQRRVPPMDRQGGGWVRLNEYWYKDLAAWRMAVIESPPSYTPPPWGGKYPFVVMGSTFIGYYPDVDFLKGGYKIP
jgi:hypothetical protein